MATDGLDDKLIKRWRQAAEDLGVRVTAPAELCDPSGTPFRCEVLVPDFGSPAGMIVVSPGTERRLRSRLRALGERLSLCIAEAHHPRAYSRAAFISELEDWGWFGRP